MKLTAKELKDKLERSQELAAPCRLCPRACGVDRTAGQTGFCNAGMPTKVYSYRQYPGEEPPLSGTKGSGVIFFSNCTMRCAYCQNYRFSQKGEGYRTDPAALCKIIVSLKKSGCHNINLVTPTHYLPVILEAFLLAGESAHDIPIAYNTSGYESKEVLGLLNGLVDIYLADMRYGDNRLSRRYSSTNDYVEINRAAVSIMHDQVGTLTLDKSGVAKRGLIIRHLVLPGLLSNTDNILGYISQHLPKKTVISLMSQYIPIYKARTMPEISRAITPEEYEEACAMLEKYELTNGWLQEL